LQYYDGQFLDDSLFGLSLYNIIQQHTNNREGNFFFNSDGFIGKDPPTVEQLKRQLKNKNTKYTSMLRHFARNIWGSDNFWRSKTKDLKHWITHHIACGDGPPTFFVTLSCAENWWPDLKCLLAQLDENAKNYPSLMTACLVYLCAILSSNIQITERVISSSTLTDSLGKTHRLWNN
jgi:hypothetical protein